MAKPDVSNAARAGALLIAQAPVDAALAAALLGPLDVLSRSASWHLRGGLLPPLALLLYRTQFIGGGGGDAARAMLERLLVDGQQEVREAAAVVYAGTVRLRGPAERARALAWAEKRTRPKAALPERHGGVLALAALLRLAPYDIPPWLPPVIEKLAPFVAAPQPIKGTVTKAFADFKRTHQDDWAAQREKLTPEQQELISDTLISPSFYA